MNTSFSPFRKKECLSGTAFASGKYDNVLEISKKRGKAVKLSSLRARSVGTSNFSLVVTDPRSSQKNSQQNSREHYLKIYYK